MKVDTMEVNLIRTRPRWQMPSKERKPDSDESHKIQDSLEINALFLLDITCTLSNYC